VTGSFTSFEFRQDQETRVRGISCGTVCMVQPIQLYTDLWQTDRQTDRQSDRRTDREMMTAYAVLA